MPIPDFKWKTYQVPLRAPEALAAAPGTTVGIDLPDLSLWPHPIDKAQVLLQTAAEVEHALLVQYLYAAYSLNLGLTGDHATAVTDWNRKLRGIARQEMGHLMTVQNLRLALGFAPTLERDDFPFGNTLYPFTFHLEPFTQRSLAKYVAAESPADAQGIDDILALAAASAGSMVNHVGTIYGLLAFVFSPGAVAPTGSPIWDEMMERVASAATQQNPDPTAWHLTADAIDAQSDALQGDPGEWELGDVTVHKISSLETAVAAIEQVAAEGEGFADSDDSHFTRFLAMYRGSPSTLPVPPAGDWVPTLAVPTDPRTADITEPRTQRWAQLADLRYAMLLGEIEHYLRTADTGNRATLKRWVFEDMRSFRGLAGHLTALPQGNGVSCLPFTVPELPLPDSEAARWAVHLARVTATIDTINVMQADPTETAGGELTTLLSAMDQRRALIVGMPTGTTTTSFVRDVRPLFRAIDVDHMQGFGLDLSDIDAVKDFASDIADRIKSSEDDVRMPPPPDAPLTAEQTALFDKWVSEGFPP